MDMNRTTATKPASSPRSDAPRAFNEMAEKGATQTKETYEKMSAATTEAADLIKTVVRRRFRARRTTATSFLSSRTQMPTPHLTLPRRCIA